MKFEELFKKVSPEKFSNDFNMFELLEKDFYVVTNGGKEEYNSMIGSGGGFGFFLKKPTNWCLFRQDRYTLELIEKYKKYTISFYSEEDKRKILLLGQETGRNNNKMEKVKLTKIETPTGNILFEEAKLVLECGLTAIIMPNKENFYSESSKTYIEKAYQNENEYRKIIFGEITDIWIKNK